ncbi:lantibiotic dehydratase [Catellatospora sp. NPDC049609]|uniref:lantibiotic dehydratase n=1 Tax=Catellatospora sp. NPDC049609 TaxID=3155505 RepID=UPI00342A1CE4
MTELAVADTTSAQHPDRQVSSTELAPYALVRLAALPYPAVPEESVPFRAGLARLVELRAWLDGAAPELADALYASAAGHDAQLHRAVVLPLRRDVHNGRLPKPALLDQLADLPDRIPLLRRWLDATAELTAVRAALTTAAGPALAAERAALAAVCAADPLRRAVTLTGADLLRGIDRAAAGGAAPDARARKSEPNALRYALRASAKTSPLSWFTYVGWGGWAEPGEPERLSGEPVAVARVNRTLLVRLVTAVLARLREQVPYRLAPSIHVEAGRVRYRRDTPLGYGDRIVAAREEAVELAYSAPMALLLARAHAAGAQGVLPAELAAALAEKLPGDPRRAAETARRYVGQVIDGGLLVAVQPAHPQDVDAPSAVAGWLAGHGEHELAALLRAIDTATTGFPALPVERRTEVLAELRRQWQAAYELAGAPWLESPPLSEDVTLRTPLRLGAAHGRDAAAGLAGLGPVVELFDQYLVFRRLTRDRFVQLHGPGGRSRDLAGFAHEMGAVWHAGNLVKLNGTISDDPAQGLMVTPELAELARARAAVCQAVAADNPAEADELRLSQDVVDLAGQVLPDWVRTRPSSYSFFVQPLAGPGATRLVLNHVYGGWGRFTSRFLDLVEPGARAAVAAQIRAGFGPGARVAQWRPVSGFNANLHPLVADDEVGEDPAWAGITTADLELWHDERTDQVRLRHTGSGDTVDLLYLGFLVPFILPDRFLPLYLDLSSGLASITHLAPARRVGGVVVRPRLCHRDLVLARRSWQLPPADVAAFAEQMAAEGDVPAEAAAGWLARHGLPPQLFLGPEGGEMTNAEDFQRYMGQYKPQFVDFGNALHLRNLPKLLVRHDRGVRAEEALPVPGAGNPDGRVVELVTEVYRKGTTR